MTNTTIKQNGFDVTVKLRGGYLLIEVIDTEIDLKRAVIEVYHDDDVVRVSSGNVAII